MPTLAELLEPIPGDSPTGASLRYDPLYEQIKRARIEEVDAPQGEWRTERKTADYGLVVKLANEALTKRSKDLQIAAWLTEARLQREGFGGLAEGLELLRELLERFWDGIYPEIDDGDLEFRAAPLAWVGQYLDAAVRASPITQGEGYNLGQYQQSRAVGYEADTSGDYDKAEARKKAIAEGKLTAEEFDEAFTATPKAWYKKLVAEIDASLGNLEALDGVATERFEDVAPSLIRLRAALEDVRQGAWQLLSKKLELEPDPVEEVAPTLGEAPSEGGLAEASAASPSAGGGAQLSAQPRDREDAVARVTVAARFLRAEAPGNPAPYLLIRGLRWGELRATTPLDPKLLSAPPTDVRSRLKGLLLDGKWKELLELGEEVMAQPYGRGWLDLQRYTLTACEALGSAYDAVAAAIAGALRTLLRDLPELPTLTMMDDTPTGNAETRSWLRERGLLPSPGEDPESAGYAVDGRRSEDRGFDRITSGDPHRAIQMLLREADQEKSPRARFLRRIQAARVMVDSGFGLVAFPILQDLASQIEKHTLEEWESGDTVAEALGLLFRCLDPGSAERESLYLRICRLDPLQAMQITSAQAADAAQV